MIHELLGPTAGQPAAPPCPLPYLLDDAAGPALVVR